ncbi:MAG TPA: AbrB/MazE/SpoVT family DNA-binding domain-containing protein [Caldilineae bacterium]|nr:AbrB/MazE/SpoVT family DNA-binding domain-containing protein [Caldilineae bacterium]
MITTVTGKNQITIPAKLVRRLNIRSGTRIDWSLGEDDELIAKPLPSRGSLARQAAGMGRDWLTADDDPIAELLAERVQDDENEGLA